MGDEVYVVRSGLDRHHRFPWLAIFASYSEAKDYQEELLEESDEPDYHRKFIRIKEVKLGEKK